MTIVDFRTPSEFEKWEVEDDVVMGGLSSGQFLERKGGTGVFSGTVSLENNGGFSSIQSAFPPIDIRGFETAAIRLKGDGKTYRFIVESKPEDSHYYECAFDTSGEWETVEVPLRKMVPVFRGDRLDRPNFPANSLCLVRFLIGNGTAEEFQLEIDSIVLESKLPKRD